MLGFDWSAELIKYLKEQKTDMMLAPEVQGRAIFAKSMELAQLR